MYCGGLARHFLCKNKMASAWSGRTKSQNHVVTVNWERFA